MSRGEFVLDSYAVLAVIEDEPGAQVVAEILMREAVAIYLSVVNLGEVYYIVARRDGESAAEQVVEHLLMEESIRVVDATLSEAREAARIKARWGISYADSFVLVLAKELEAPVITGDPEIRALAGELGIQVVWIGPPAG